MANPTWPAGLPGPLVDGCGYAPGFDNTLRTQMTGAQKMRRRQTFVPEVVTFRLAVDRSQMYGLSQFVITTLGDVGLFDWYEFRDPAKGAATYRFRRRPIFSPVSSNLWHADIELDLLTPFSGAFQLGDDLGAFLADDDETITT
ncbi:MAG: hypothetical protein J7507_12150 [Pseudoxanthomonas sp.]|nr:hypothetical protein [Pseudoxanthomonas sp.]